MLKDGDWIRMLKLVFLRHEQSMWNFENKFTGWTDVEFSGQAIQEANEAGKVLKAENYTFDVSHTSVLKRSIRTLWIVLEELDLMWTHVCRKRRLNERHYGAIQGLNKKTVADKFGVEQVKVWRRSLKTFGGAGIRRRFNILKSIGASYQERSHG